MSHDVAQMNMAIHSPHIAYFNFGKPRAMNLMKF